MIAPEPFFEPRGTPISVLQRLRALSSLGHTVDLVTYHVGEDVAIGGVTLHRIPRIPFVGRIKAGPSLVKLFLDGFLFWRAFGRLCRERYQVIHTHEEAAFFGIVLSAIFRTRHVYDMHSSLPRQLENFGFGAIWPAVKLFQWLERAVLNTCDAVITVGEDLEQVVRTINPGIPVQRIDNLAMTQDRDGYRESPSLRELQEGFRRKGYLPIVYTGSFERYQGLDMLMECAGIVVRSGAKVVFVLVGGKEDQVRVLKLAARNQGLTEQIVFTGIVPPEKALAYLQSAEILVSPRIAGTSIPLKIYSYLHAGKAILATRVPAHSQVLNDEIALLVDPTPQALAEGVLRLAGDPEVRRGLAQNSQDFARRRYDLAVYTSDLEALYGDIFRPAPLVDAAVRPTEN